MSAGRALVPEEPDRDELVEKLRAAFERAFAVIPRLPGTDQSYEATLHSLDCFYGPCPPVPPACRPASEATTKQELQNLKKQALALAEIVRSLHGPAIDLLAAVGFVRDDPVHGGLATQAEQAAARAAKALDLTDTESEEVKGRPSQPRPLIIAQGIVRAFRELTGEDPWRNFETYRAKNDSGVQPGPEGVCVRLVDEVFKILTIDADARHAVRAALQSDPVSAEEREAGVGTSMREARRGSRWRRPIGK